MPIYAVIAADKEHQSSIDATVNESISERDRHPSSVPGFWFVRSDHITSSQLATQLNCSLEGGRYALVLRVADLAGVALRPVIDTLAAWEDSESG